MQLIESKRDIALKLDLAKFARPVSFRPGAIAFEPAPGAPSNLAQRLAARLKEWTGQTWLVAAEGGGGGESLYEREQRERLAARKEIEADPFVRSVMQAFPGRGDVAGPPAGDAGRDERCRRRRRRPATPQHHPLDRADDASMTSRLKLRTSFGPSDSMLRTGGGGREPRSAVSRGASAFREHMKLGSAPSPARPLSPDPPSHSPRTIPRRSRRRPTPGGSSRRGRPRG